MVDGTKLALLCLGGVRFVAPVALAPMTDVINVVFQGMCLEFSRQGSPAELARPGAEQEKG